MTWRPCVAAAVLGAVALIAGAVLAPPDAAMSYLVVYTATLAVVLGMLLLAIMARLSGAVWFVLLQRRADAVVGALPALAVMAVPFIVAPRAFWPSLSSWLPFTARLCVYWAVWLVVGESVRRDAGRSQAFSVAGVAATALALTFASFDWMMSLDRGWSSTVYGPYYFAGAMVSALGLVAVLARRMAAAHPEWSPTTEHFQALGRLTLAFVLFWAYLWYAQFLIIWIADIPREATWYLVRLRGGWGVLGLATLAAGAVVPFLVLAFRAARGSAIVMSTVGVCLLVVHYLDVYWLLVPGGRVRWTPVDALCDAGAVAFVVGTAGAVAVWRDADRPAAPVGDSMLAASLRYEAH